MAEIALSTVDIAQRYCRRCKRIPRSVINVGRNGGVPVCSICGSHTEWTHVPTPTWTLGGPYVVNGSNDGVPRG